MRAKEVVRKMFEDIKSNWYLPVTEWQVYSTAETKVGVWTDGKPLYRKTIVDDNPTFTSQNSNQAYGEIQNVLPTEMETIVNVYGVAYNNIAGTENVTFASHSLYLSSGGLNYGYDVIVRKNINGFAFIMQSGNSEITPASTLTKQIITIEYTKTTDTAATTPKIPFEPLTEYSTEEKMVGYWIDGKELYRKSYNVPSVTMAGLIVDSSINCNNTKIRHTYCGSFTVGGAYNNNQYASLIASTSQEQYIRVLLVEGGLRVQLQKDFGSGNNVTNFSFTIEYTKTT